VGTEVKGAEREKRRTGVRLVAEVDRDGGAGSVGLSGPWAAGPALVAGTGAGTDAAACLLAEDEVDCLGAAASVGACTGAVACGRTDAGAGTGADVGKGDGLTTEATGAAAGLLGALAAAAEAVGLVADAVVVGGSGLMGAAGGAAAANGGGLLSLAALSGGAALAASALDPADAAGGAAAAVGAFILVPCVPLDFFEFEDANAARAASSMASASSLTVVGSPVVSGSSTRIASHT
jgi:hypothetical protein